MLKPPFRSTRVEIWRKAVSIRCAGARPGGQIERGRFARNAINAFFEGRSRQGSVSGARRGSVSDWELPTPTPADAASVGELNGRKATSQRPIMSLMFGQKPAKPRENRGSRFPEHAAPQARRSAAGRRLGPPRSPAILRPAGTLRPRQAGRPAPRLDPAGARTGRCTCPGHRGSPRAWPGQPAG